MLGHVLAVVLGIVLLAAIWGLWTYIRLFAHDRTRQEAWNDVLARLGRRRELIPVLAETVRAYAPDEKDLFKDAARLRPPANGATPSQTAESERVVSETLVRLFAVAEQHPELIATRNFRQVHAALSDAEDAIQAARRRFNAAALDYNILVASFSGHSVASRFGFRQSEYFTLESPSEKDMPTVAL